MNARKRLFEGLPVAERRLRLDGVSTALLEGGEGEPLVLLHGPNEYGAKWFRVIPHLVHAHRVIVPDLPGHGESAPFEGPATRVLAWLDALIAATCTTPPALVGHIVGGAIAARFAAERGERIGGLVLVDALGLAPFEPAPEFGAALAAFLSRPDEATHDALWSRCAFDLDRLRDSLGESWNALKAYNLDRARSPELKPLQQRLMEEFGFPPIADDALGAIRAPTELIWGRHDLATRVGVAEAAASRYGWPLQIIEGAADDPPLEQPDAFVEALRAALARERGDTRSPAGRGRSANIGAA
jgi:pimeloyl-ACP methyl ester carboxylesterase